MTSVQRLLYVSFLLVMTLIHRLGTFSFHVDDDVCDHLDDIEDGDDEDALVIITVVKNLNYEKISF